MKKEKLKELLRFLVASVAKESESIQIDERDEEDCLVLNLRVANNDMGRVIGKGGKTAKAIRALMQAANDSDSKKVVVNILE